MSSLFIDIDRFRNNQYILSLNRELNDIKDKDKYKERINEIQEELTKLCPDKEKYDMMKSLNDVYDIYDKNKFKQPWRSLTREQKRQKIHEYDSDMSSKEINNVIDKKKVKYDPSNEEINDII